MAALAGGTTAIIDFANQTRGKSPLEALNIWMKKADSKTYCDYGFHLTITDVSERTLQEMET